MENIFMSLSNFFGGGLVLLIGLLLRFVKGTEGMIAGYNTMSIAEKEKWDAAKLRIFLGNVLIILSCVMIAAGVLVLSEFYPVPVITGSWVIFSAAIIFCAVYVNTNSRFKAEKEKYS